MEEGLKRQLTHVLLTNQSQLETDWDDKDYKMILHLRRILTISKIVSLSDSNEDSCECDHYKSIQKNTRIKINVLTILKK